MAIQGPSGRRGEDVDADEGGFTEINIVPLVDIMLVLLVTLMATSTAIVESGQGANSGFRVQLPSGSESEEISAVSDELVVAVLGDGAVVLSGEEVDLTQLEERFREAASSQPGRLVLVQADEGAIHKRVVEVMEAARRAGLTNLAIATQPDEK
jgi:biopolymer transport protein ExbD